MEYPVNDRTFDDLLEMRKQMISLKPNVAAVAWPFLPFVGSKILEGAPGIYFIGIATRGDWIESKDLAEGQKMSRDYARDSHSGPFWRYIQALSERVFGLPFLDCIETIAWSNQFKIGVQDGNPSGDYAKVQQDLSRLILERELHLASRCAVVFLGDVDVKNPVLPEYFHRESNWNTEKYRRHGVWVKQTANGAPVFYQYHPRAFTLPSNRINFDEQVATMA
jgi:hypothetical protein